MSANAIATEYLKNLLGHMRKERTKGMLATRVPSADFQPTDDEETSGELDESALERLLEGDDSPHGELSEAPSGENEMGESASGENAMSADDEAIPHGEEGRIDDGKLKAVRTMGRSSIGFSRKR